MLFSIINDKLEDNFIVEAETIEDCQNITINNLIKRGWLMEDCHSIDLEKELLNG